MWCLALEPCWNENWEVHWFVSGLDMLLVIYFVAFKMETLIMHTEALGNETISVI